MLIAVGGIVGRPGVASTWAAESASSNELDRLRADVAVLASTGPDGTPRLLVVDPVAADATAARLAILERDTVWSAVATTTVDLDLAGRGPTRTPWLVGLGGDRFVLIASADQQIRTHLARIDIVDGDGGPAIIEREAVTVHALVADAGAADVEADGTPDLVLAQSGPASSDASCRGSVIEVMPDGDLGQPVAVATDVLIHSGVIGPFDGTPGDDLAVYTMPVCTGETGAASPADLRVIRLTDGTRVASLPAVQGDLPVWFASPSRLDIDGDGRAELLARLDRGLSIIDPSDGWSRLRIATPAALPLGMLRVRATPDESLPSRTRVAWLEPSIDGRGSIGVEDVRRELDGSLDSGPATVHWDSNPPSSRWRLAVASAMATRGRPVAWLGGGDGERCPDVVVPTAVLSCATGDIIAAPMWVGARPVLGIGDGVGRRMLVAVGQDVLAGSGLPQTPDPWGDGAGGRWRAGPSALLALAEVDEQVASSAPVLRPVVMPQAELGPGARIAAADGTRLYVATVGLGVDEPPSQADLDPVAAVLGPVPPDATADLVRLPVRPGAASGVEHREVTVPLAAERWSGGGPAVSWSATVIPFTDVGDVDAAYVVTVRRDVDPPRLALLAPLLSPVWPVATTLHGTTEPGAVVRLSDGPPVVADAGGAFALDTALAPWPQSLDIRAADAAGNVATLGVSVVGGVDYRTFPWASISAVAVLAAVVISGVLGTRRRRGVASTGPHDGADGPAPELEELAPGDGL
jgi:hypothetical protein